MIPNPTTAVVRSAAPCWGQRTGWSSAPAAAPDDTRTDDPEGLPMRYHHLARVGLVKRVMMAERPGPMRVVAREDDSAVRRDRRAG